LCLRNCQYRHVPSCLQPDQWFQCVYMCIYYTSINCRQPGRSRRGNLLCALLRLILRIPCSPEHRSRYTEALCHCPCFSGALDPVALCSTDLVSGMTTHILRHNDRRSHSSVALLQPPIDGMSNPPAFPICCGSVTSAISGFDGPGATQRSAQLAVSGCIEATA
jgi:hypothetical protein